MGGSDFLLMLLGVVLLVLGFLWEHRGVVAVVLVLMALGDIALNVGSAAEALSQIHRLLDSERRGREKQDSEFY